MNSFLRALLLSMVLSLAVLGIVFLSPESQAPTVADVPRRDVVKLTVEVLEKNRGRRLEGSRIWVSRLTEGDRVGKQIYDSGSGKTTGLFEIELPPGAYKVRVSCRRYEGKSRSVTLPEDTPQRVVFELAPWNSISGRILTRSGSPISGARVMGLEELVSPDADLEDQISELMCPLYRTGTTVMEAVSAEDGSYQLAGLEFKTYAVRVVAAGYAPSEVDRVPVPSAEVDVVLVQGGSVTGLVRDASGFGVAAASVKAYLQLDSQNVFKVMLSIVWPPVDTAVSDSVGRFRFDTLGPGIYNFRIGAKGYQTSEERKITVSDGASLSFTLKPGLVLRGFVTGPDSEPVPGAKVRVYIVGVPADRKRDHVAPERDILETNEQGEFVFDTLAQGNYTVLCWDTGADYATLRRNYVQVRRGMAPLSLKLARGEKIRGRVLDRATMKPIAGALISTYDVGFIDVDLRKEAVSKEDGSFFLRGLAMPPRPLRIRVDAADYATGRRRVKVQKNQESEEVFQLAPTGVVAGRVIDLNGKPVAGARVTASDTREFSGIESSFSTDLTGHDGSFSLSGVHAGKSHWIRVKKCQYVGSQSAVFQLEPFQRIDIGAITVEGLP